MAITYSETWTTLGTGITNVITSGSIDVSDSGGKRVIVAICVNEDRNTHAMSIANSGTALSWTQIAQPTTDSNCGIAAWWAYGDNNGNRTITVTQAPIADNAKSLAILVHTGAHQTTPVPVGKVFSGVGGTDISQAITPTAIGSALWFGAGDWGQTNSYAGVANCTIDQTHDVAGRYTSALIRPTTQPRTDAAAFTIGETDTAGTIAWLAFEVQAAPPATVITQQPGSQSVRVGDKAMFMVNATGNGTLHYDWEVDTGGGFANASGATDANTYQTPTLAIGDDGDIYRCNVSDDNGTTVSASATLHVRALTYGALGTFDAELTLRAWF